MRMMLVTVMLLFAQVSSAGEAPATPAHYQASDTIVILGAVPQEITIFTDAMGKPPQQQLWGIPYYRGQLAGKNVVVAITEYAS